MRENVFSVAVAYQGITGIAHGGYVAGLLAGCRTEAATVMLRRPPPLETPLAVQQGRLLDDAGRTVMESGPAVEFAEVPAVSLEEARRRHPHPRFADHPYPDCFMCGTAPQDGFHLRVSSADAAGLAVGTWTPDGSLLNDSEVVAPQFVWAAVDCLTVWSFADRWSDPQWWPAVTGQIAVEQRADVRRGRPYVAVGRLAGREGRKVTVDATLADAAGEVCARGRAVWVVVPRQA